MADRRKFTTIIPVREKITLVPVIYGDYELEPNDEFIDVNVTPVGDHAWEIEPVVWFSSDSVFRLRITARGPKQALRIFQAALTAAIEEETL